MQILTVRCFILFLLFTPKISWSISQHFLDSTYQVLKNTNDDQEKLLCLYTLAFEYGNTDPAKALNFARQCLALATQSNDTLYQLAAYNAMGNAYESLARYDQALQYHYKTFLMGSQLKSLLRMATSIGNMAIALKEMGDYKQALKLNLAGLNLLQADNQNHLRYHFYTAELYLALNNIDRALYHTRLAIDSAENSEHEYLLPVFHINLGKCVFHLGFPDSALNILHQSEIELAESSEQFNYAICLKAMASIYESKNDFEKALDYYESELHVQQSIRNNNGICLAQINIAYLLSKGTPASKSDIRSYLMQAEKNSLYIKKNVHHLRYAFLRMAEVYEFLEMPVNALNYYKKYDALNQQIHDAENMNQINDLQIKYQTAEKEKLLTQQKAELNQSKHSNQRKSLMLWMLVLTMVLLMVSALAIYQKLTLKQKLNFALQIEEQKKQQEMQSIRNELKERERISKDLHDELGSGITKISLMAEYMRQNANGSKLINKNITSIASVAKTLADNMRDLVWALNPQNNLLDQLLARMHEYANEYLEDINIETQFIFPFKVPDLTISKEMQRNVFMAYKEAIHNALKHSGCTRLEIEVTFTDQILSIVLRDNGKGFTPGPTKTVSHGIRNMMQRMKDIQGECVIESSILGGTCIYFKIPTRTITTLSNTTFMG